MSRLRILRHANPVSDCRELDLKFDQARLGGGSDRIEKQHGQGKLSARERIDLLIDPGSFEEYDMLRLNTRGAVGDAGDEIYGDGVVTGSGLVDGRRVFVYAQDFTVKGGSLSRTQAEKICKIMDMAEKIRAPVIALNDSGGTRVQDGIDSLAGYGEIFYRNVMLSGIVPQITAVLGPCAGGAVYSPAVQDFVIMNRSTSYMFITGPRVVKKVIYENVTAGELGGAEIHTRKSGVAHFLAEDDRSALETVRRLLSYLPQSNREPIPRRNRVNGQTRGECRIGTIVPADTHHAYDIRDVVTSLADDGDFMEVASEHAPNIVTVFCRLDGYSVGVVANQPKVKAGVLDIDSSVKAARFVRFCDAFGIPLVSLVDVPGFMPGTAQEQGGIIRHGAKLLYAFAEATVPKVTVILRKAYGGAYIIMNSRHLRGDIVYAWPSAEIAVMGSESATEIIFRKESVGMSDPDAYIRKREEEYRRDFANPFRAAERGYVDQVIRPEETRTRLIRALELLRNKKEHQPERKHGCMPL